MEILNQILVQLAEADRFACAANPHCRRLAVVLLDNIVELQLRRKSEMEFLFDRTTWYSGPRKHNHQTRRAIFRWHQELLAFAERQGWLDSGEVRVLAYAHRIRNEAYHEGGFNALDGELAVRMLYALIKKRFPEWRTARGLVFISPNAPVRIERASNDPSGNAPLLTRGEALEGDIFSQSSDIQSAGYWEQAIADVLKYEGASDTRQLIHDRIIAYLDDLERSMDFIEHDSEGINFFDVISHRMTIFTPAFSHAVIDGKSTQSYNYALNVYAAVLPEEERLLDIVDPRDRAAACHELFTQHAFHRKFMPKERVRKYRRQAVRVLQMDDAAGIELFLKIEADLSAKRETVKELASDLDGHISHLIDLARGK
jgi:hypothetical protein